MSRNTNPTILVAATFVSVFLIGAQPSQAQLLEVNSESNSSSNSSAVVQSSAYSAASGGSGGAGGSGYGGSGYGGNSQVYLDQRGPGTTKATVRAAPAVQAPSMGSGHPCALGGSIGISIIGGGVSGGANKVDEACLLAQMGQGHAALIMIARRDSEACIALRQVGTIPSNSVCSSSERQVAQRAQRTQRTQARSSTNQSSGPAIASMVTCSRNTSGQIVARKRSGSSFTDEQFANFCRGQMK